MSQKIIEGMKQLKVIEKRIQKNTQEITQYASMVNTERPSFDSDVEQKRQVESRIQANKDLLKEYLFLKRKIEYTNLNTVVEIGGVSYTISDLLVIKRHMAKAMLETYDALNLNAAQSRMQRGGYAGPTGEKIQAIAMYDEKTKNAGRREWQDLYDNINSRLEVINATTDLSELP
jgi:phenylalanyl-tRNA synthetase alpha subunit